MAWDWFFSPTDNINLIIEIAAGIIVTAWVAGVRSKQRIVAYLSDKESDPVIERIAEVVARKVEVPTVAQIVAQIPAPPDITDKLALFEERLGTKLTAQLDAKLVGIQDQLAERMGRVFQANIASAKAAWSASMQGVEGAFDPENDGSLLTEIAGVFMDEDSVKKLARAKRMWSKFQAQGGLSRHGNGGAGQSPQGQQGYAYGTVVGEYVATPQGWKKLEAAPRAQIAPPPAAAAPLSASDLPPELPAESPPK